MIDRKEKLPMEFTVMCFREKTIKELTHVWKTIRSSYDRERATEMIVTLYSPKHDIAIRYNKGVWNMKDYEVISMEEVNTD